MNEALLLILAFLWALMLLPGAIRARRSSPRATVGGFHHAMEVLRDRPAGRSVMVPHDSDRIVHAPMGAGPHARVAAERPPEVGSGAGDRRDTARAVTGRRRRLFARLLMATVGLLVVALIAGGLVWVLFGVSTTVLVGYAVVLRRWKLERDQAREVVRALPPTGRPGRRATRSGHPAAAPGGGDEESSSARVAGGGAVADYAVGPLPGTGHVKLRHWRGEG